MYKELSDISSIGELSAAIDGIVGTMPMDEAYGNTLRQCTRMLVTLSACYVLMRSHVMDCCDLSDGVACSGRLNPDPADLRLRLSCTWGEVRNVIYFLLRRDRTAKAENLRDSINEFGGRCIDYVVEIINNLSVQPPMTLFAYACTATDMQRDLNLLLPASDDAVVTCLRSVLYRFAIGDQQVTSSSR